MWIGIHGRRFSGEAKQQQLEGQDSQSPPINLGVFGTIRSEKRFFF